MKWYTEKPTKPGWYWMKWDSKLSTTEAVKIWDSGRNQLRVISAHLSRYLDHASFKRAKWAGPIPEPEE